MDRLQSETAVITQQNQVRKQMLAQFGEQQKAQHSAQVDMDLQREAVAVEQRGNAQLMGLQQASIAQTLANEQKATDATLRYQYQVAEEDLQQRGFNLQRQYYEAEMQIASQLEKVARGEMSMFANSQSVASRSRLPAQTQNSNSVAQAWLPSADSERNMLRDIDSFDAYLGRPGGPPSPSQSSSRWMRPAAATASGMSLADRKSVV